MCEPIGPIENGITYMVRPRMQPSNRLFSLRRISMGSSQLLVGPASSFCALQMKVRSSMRATSLGCERARYELGRRFSDSRTNVPEATSCAHSRSYSASEPSHQTMRSGFASLAISDTHWRRPRWRTQAGAFDWSAGAAAGAFMRFDSRRQTAQRKAGPTRRIYSSANSSIAVVAGAGARPLSNGLKYRPDKDLAF